jgi:DNA polymerase-4
VVFAEPIAHVDMDAFFVEVERLRRPELIGVPVVVAGLGKRGVVSCASYEARRSGVDSGMPTGRARRLCPDARFLAPDHEAFSSASDRVFAVLRSFTPKVEPVSVDEAFLDIGGLRLRYPSASVVGETIRAALREHTGLPASVGLAASKFIAKMASREAKPDGLLLVPAGAEVEFLRPLPVRALWGVGESTCARLEELGVKSIGDITAVPQATLKRRLGVALGAHVWELAHARDERRVETDSERRSLSVENTYEQDISGKEALETELLRHADRLASRLRRSAESARTVSVKVRYADFTTVTRSETLAAPIETSHEIFEVALRLLERAGVGDRPVRLLGIGAGALEDAAAPRQLGLDQTPWEDLDAAVERVRSRYGRKAVGRARLLASAKLQDESSQEMTEAPEDLG